MLTIGLVRNGASVHVVTECTVVACVCSQAPDYAAWFAVFGAACKVVLGA